MKQAFVKSKGNTMLNCNWENLFSGQILSRGHKYYRSERYEMDNNTDTMTVNATVFGTEEYEVEINYSKFPKIGLYCNCPYALGGMNCKHMAAVLYSMEYDTFDYSNAAETIKKLKKGSSAQNRSGVIDVAPSKLKKADEGRKSVDTGLSGRNAGRTERRPEAGDNKILYPFAGTKSGNSVGEYQYFNFAKLTEKLNITENMLRKAIDFSESEYFNGGIYINCFNQGEAEADSAVLVASGTFLKTKAEMEEERKAGRSLYGNSCTAGYIRDEYEVRVRLNRKALTELVCECFACRKKRGLRTAYYSFYEGKIDTPICEHILAVLMQVDSYIKENHPGDSTDLCAIRLLRGFTTGFSSDESEDSAGEKKTVSLLPQLQTCFRGLKVNFKIGNDKMYMLKNLEELVDYAEKRKVLPLGKNQEIDFAKETFRDEMSEKLYELIAASVHEEKARSEQLGYGYGSLTGDRNTMLLIGHNLDSFFDICKGLHVERKGALKGDRGILLTDQNPKLKLKIESEYSEDKVFQGVHVSGTSLLMIKGAGHSYYTDEEKICRISPEFAAILKIICPQFESAINFRVGRKYLGKFFGSVLPVLSRVADIDNCCREAIENFLPPEPAFAFYLDMEQDEPICNIDVCYGEKKFNCVEAAIRGAYASGMRDLDREREVAGIAQRYFTYFDYENKRLVCKNEGSLYNLLNEGLSELLQLGEVNMSEAFKRLRIKPRPKVNVGVAVKSDLLELSIESEDISREELLELLNGFKKKKKYVRLKNGDFMRMDDDGLEELGAMMETLHLSPKEFAKGKMKLPLYRALYLDKMIEQNSGIYAERDKTFKKLVKEFKTVNESDFEVPQKLEKVLRNYQAFGFKWLKTVESCHFGGILADDMGLGKTLQIISLILDAKEKQSAAADADKKGTVSLVVSPASLVYNWKAEFERFAPELKVCTVTGTQQERAEIIKTASEWDVLVTSYDLLKRDIAEYEDVNFAYEVIDEAQFIKNHNTAAAKAVKVINSRQRYALTGTPIENRLSELWSIFDYLMPGFLYGYDVFRREFEAPISKDKNEAMMEQLKRMVAPFILRRLKKDVLRDIPDKLEEVYYARMSDEQRKVYDGEVVKIRKSLEKESDEEFKNGRSKMDLLAELTRIRQICCDPHLLFEDYRGDSAKKETCLDLIKSALEGDHRVLLFSQFTSMLDILEKALEAEKIGYYKIVGATSKEKRIELVNDFNSGKDNVNVFLISLKAGGTGLNLTGADVVIHFDPWWNVAAQNQATDRAHRIGQTKVVSVYKLIAKDTIEEKILKMQEEKRNLAENILSGETGGLVGMSREEVMELLG